MIFFTQNSAMVWNGLFAGSLLLGIFIGIVLTLFLKRSYSGRLRWYDNLYQETIESMVAPSAFQGAASSIRTRAWHYIWRMVLRALLLSAVLAGGLRLFWRLPPPAPVPATGPKETPNPPAGEHSGG